MDRTLKLVKYFKLQALYWKSRILHEIQDICRYPIEYVILSGLKDFQIIGKICLSPIQILGRLRTFEDLENLELAPSTGIQSFVPDALMFFGIFRTLLHFALGFSKKFDVIEGGYFTVDGVLFLLTSFSLLMLNCLYWFVRTKRQVLCWFSNQSALLQKNFSHKFLGGKGIVSVFAKDPSVLLFFYLGQQLKFIVPILIVVLVVVCKTSPLFLASNPFVGNVVTYLIPLPISLSIDIFGAGFLLIIFSLGSGLLIAPLFLIVLCIRSLRSEALSGLNWRKRKSFYVRLELLSSIFGDEINSVLPPIIAYGSSAVVASLVLAVKLVDMRLSFLMPPVFLMLAFSYGLGGLSLLKMAESLETESMGLLGDFCADIAKEFKSMRLARLLTRRRLIRYNVGHFMFIENGAALAMLMAVLDNTVSGIFMVAPTSTSYILKLP